MIQVTAPVRIDISAGWSDAAPFVNEFGGAVLNAAIDWRVKGTLKKGKLTTSLEKVPSNSGLGTSGALRTVYLAVANPKLLKDKIELIKRVHTFENAIVGQRAGFQDQAAAVFGGVNYWEFKRNGAIVRKKIIKSDAYHLQDRLLLVFTGEGHISANVHERVFEGRSYIKYIPQIDRMRVLARKMCYDMGNEFKMTKHLRETWELQKKLHKHMETGAMKAIQHVCKDSMLAGRATGAGGGGCFLVYLKPEMRRTATLRINSLKKKYKKLRILPFEFDYRGIEVEEE
jgi:D-glycero-alpha-D-manno-heptose-7-phosphate kinase